jgi:hypothetical protein
MRRCTIGGIGSVRCPQLTLRAKEFCEYGASGTDGRPEYGVPTAEQARRLVPGAPLIIEKLSARSGLQTAAELQSLEFEF